MGDVGLGDLGVFLFEELSTFSIDGGGFLNSITKSINRRAFATARIYPGAVYLLKFAGPTANLGKNVNADPIPMQG